MAQAYKSDMNKAIDDSRMHEDLLSEIADNKSKAAFEQLFDFYAPRLKSFYLQQRLTSEEAEDLLQETFIMIWRKAGQFNASKATVSTWIYTIARNKRIDYLRKDIRRAEDPVEFLPEIAEDNHTGPEEKMIQSDLSYRIKDIINKMPVEQGDILKLAYFKGMTHQEIAKAKNIPLGTVKSRMRLAMDRLSHAWASVN
jgi:RNA polymerase sigma-70 factor (ECF subfamily)